MASFNSLDARKATFLLAPILIASPVAGLRPMRAPLFLTCNMPRPAIRIRSPFFKCLVIRHPRWKAVGSLWMQLDQFDPTPMLDRPRGVVGRAKDRSLYYGAQVFAALRFS